MDREVTPAAQTTPPETERSRPRWRRTLRLAVRIVAVVVLLVVVAALGLLWRLSRGPISLAFLTETIEERVDPLIAPLSLELDDVVLAFVDWRQPFSLRVQGLELFADAEGEAAAEPLAAFDDVGVLVSMAALLRGEIAVLGIELTGIRLTAVRTEEGDLDFGLHGHRASSDHPDIAELVERFVRPDREEGLRRIRLRDAALDVEDHGLDLSWGVESIGLDLERRDSVIEGNASADLTVDSAATSFTAAATFTLGERALEGRLSLPEVIPQQIGPRLYEWSGWQALDRPAAVEATFTTAADLEVRSATLAVEEEHLELEATLERGGAPDGLSAEIRVARIDAASFAGLDERLSLLESFQESLRADVDLQLERRRVRHVELVLGGIDTSRYPGSIDASVDVEWEDPDPDAGEEDPAPAPRLSGEVQLARLQPWRFAPLGESLQFLKGATVSLSGRLDFVLTGSELERLDYDLTLGAGEILIEKFYTEPHHITSGSFRGTVSEGLSKLRLTEGRVQSDQRTVTAEIEADKTERGYDLLVKAELNHYDHQAALALWPPRVNPEAREWAAERLAGSQLGSCRVEVGGALERSPGPDSSIEWSLERLDGTLPFTGMEVELSTDLVVEGVDGELYAAGEVREIRIARAGLRDLSITDVKGTLVDGSGDGELAVSFEGKLSGPIPTVRSVLSSEPFDVLEPDTLAGVDGRVQAEVQGTFPLGGEEKQSGEEVEIALSARLQPVSWLDGPLGLDLDHGDLTLTLADRRLEVAGELDVRGTPAEIVYRQDFDRKGRFEVEAVARVDQATVIAFGLPEQRVLQGSTDLDIRYLHHGSGRGSVMVKGDLTPLEIALAEVEWAKDIGEWGSLEVEAQIVEDSVTIERLTIDSAGLEIAGRAELATKPFALNTIELPTLHWAHNRVHATLRAQGENDYELVLGGEVLDLGPSLAYLRDRFHQPEGTPDLAVSDSENGLPALTLEVALQRLLLPHDVEVGSLLANARYNGEHLEELHLVGKLGTDGVVQSGLRAAGEGYTFDFAAADVAVLVGAFYDTSMEGGNVRVTAARPTAEAAWQGHVEMKDFRFLEQPTFARVLSLASLTGLATAFDNDGLEIKSHVSDFTLTPERLELIKAKTFGPACYTTANGVVNLDDRTIELDGSVAPATTLQRVLGKIPVVNWLLTGKDGEGFLATHFHLSGPLSNPEVDVSPISAVTPELVQDIADVFEPHRKKSEP